MPFRYGTLLLLFALAIPAAHAQSGSAMERMERLLIGRISGAVVDGETGQPASSATVAVWNAADSTLVTGAVADADGLFEVERLQPGRYYVQVTFVGFTPSTISDVALTRQAPALALGTIRLAPDARQLGEVEVTAERDAVTFALDRTIYNTRDMALASGGSAVDLLQQVPSVEVDVDGKVSLRGNQNVAIYLNGKPIPVRGEFLSTFMEQLPSHMIERVEVMPNPSAKYDPDGMAGILNIVLKQDAELGLSGGLTAGVGTNDNYNASVNLNFQKGRATLFTTYGFRTGDREIDGYNFRENRYQSPLTFLEQDNDGLRGQASHLVNTSLDYRLNDKSTLTGSALLSTRSGNSESGNLYNFLDAGRTSTGSYDRVTDSEGDGLNMDYRLSFRRVVQPSTHELSAGLRFSRSWNDDASLYAQQGLSGTGFAFADAQRQQTTLDNADADLEATLDYSRPIAGFQLEAGYKGTLRSLDAGFFSETYDFNEATFRPDAGLNNDFVYDEQVHALYGLLGRDMGAFDVKAGLRLEQAMTTFDLETTDEKFDNNYFSVFPSVFVGYELAQGQQLKASYSKRIERPRTRQLNPFSSFDDPLNRFVGNPYLAPEYTHSMEIAYQRLTRTGSVSLTPFYRHSENVVRRLKTVDDGGLSTTTFQNLQTSDSYGAEMVGTLRLGRRLSAFTSFNAYRLVTDGSNLEADLGNAAVTWSVRGSASWQVNDGLSAQLFYFYRAPVDVEQGHISSFSMANLSLRQQLLNDKANLTVRLSDPFNTMGFQFETEDDNFYQLGRRKWGSRQLSLSFTYQFGDAGQRRRDRGNSEMEGEGFDDVGIN